MFQQLVPLLRQRSVLLTVTSLEEDQIRVNVLPKKLSDGENAALTTPMSFTGTAAELDAQLPDAIVSFVASHLELKNTLGRAKEEMAAAAKAAQDEARNKSKTGKKTELAAEYPKKDEQKVVEPPVPSLFDLPAPVSTKLTPPLDSDEEDEILAEIKQDEETEEDDEVLVASYSAG
jgi:PRTRC genetic system protein E